MQKRFNILVPLACPHCLAELMLTLDQVQQEESVRCTSCGTTIDLNIEMCLPPEALPAPEDFLAL
jgi:predicted Zn finger-like uncharacterized protein